MLLLSRIICRIFYTVKAYIDNLSICAKFSGDNFLVTYFARYASLPICSVTFRFTEAKFTCCGLIARNECNRYRNHLIRESMWRCSYINSKKRSDDKVEGRKCKLGRWRHLITGLHAFPHREKFDWNDSNPTWNVSHNILKSVHRNGSISVSVFTGFALDQYAAN